MEHGQGHVGQDEEGDEHGNESRTEQVLRHEVEDDVGQYAHGVAEPALADLDDPQVLEGKQGSVYIHSLKARKHTSVKSLGNAISIINSHLFKLTPLAMAANTQCFIACVNST